MVVAQGDVFWADLPEARGSGPGLRLPVLIVQGNAFNQSRIPMVVAVPLTKPPSRDCARQRVFAGPGHRTAEIFRVANVSQIVTIDRGLLTERTAHISRSQLEDVLSGIDLVLGRESPSL